MEKLKTQHSLSEEIYFKEICILSGGIYERLKDFKYYIKIILEKKIRKDDQLPSVHREPGLDSQQEYEDLPSRQMINQRSFYQKYIKYL